MAGALDERARASWSFPTSMTDFSLITVTYRSATTMPGFLAAARQAVPTAEIVVIDNASDDDTVRVVGRHDPGCKGDLLRRELWFFYSHLLPPGAWINKPDTEEVTL